MKKFKTKLTSRGPGGAWTFLEIPFSVERAFGSKARVPVTLDVDRSERVVVIPPELEKALAANKKAAAAFEALPYSHRKEYADWIVEAKKEETRLGRAEKSIAMVLARKHVR